jgi:hypothetical protein
MDNSEPFKALRKFPRFPLDLRIKVNFKVNKVTQRALVKTIEIATHGISVNSPVELPLNSQLELEILLPGTKIPLRLWAVIRNKNGTRYGVEFLSASDAQRNEISQFASSRKPAVSVGSPINTVPVAN